ncbi:cyclin-like protein [Mycena leptocephala]|nr:cyclin-like protein [Mycena leptocephala]KAJ7922037.1 cyclin-like protein [Mycena leptocephala]
MPSFNVVWSKARRARVAVLANWIIQVHNQFSLRPETLLLTFNILYRVLSHRDVPPHRLQLVGIASLLIAAKFEDTMVSDLIYLTGDVYSGFDIAEEDLCILGELGWRLSYPSPIYFIQRLSELGDWDPRSRMLARYLVETSCIESSLQRYQPSLLGAAAMWLADISLGKGTGNKVEHSSYSKMELLGVARIMCQFIDGSGKQSALFDKYARKKYMKVNFANTYTTLNYPDLYISVGIDRVKST